MAKAKRFTGYTRRDGLFRPSQRVGYVSHCAVCGVVFFSRRPDALYHSNACRQKAYRMRLRMARRASAMADGLRQMRLAL